MRHLLCILSLCLLASEGHNAFAVENRGLAFLRIGVGGRAVGMGEAFSAVADGAAATYWNPAGLASRKREVTFSHNEWLQNIRGEFIAVSFSTGRIGWGWHFLSSHVDGIELRDRPSAEPLGTFGSENLSTGLSVGVPVTDHLDVGVTVKILYEKIFVESATGAAVDLGARYRVGSSGLTGALVVRHWGGMNRLRSESTPLPTTVHWGVAYAVDQWLGRAEGVTLAADLETAVENDDHLSLGAEIEIAQGLAVRAGYRSGFNDRGFSGGIGIQITPLTFDYGMTPYASDLGATHRVSISFLW